MRRSVLLVLRDIAPKSPVFSTNQVARLAEVSVSRASHDLGEAAKLGIVMRIKRGVWGYPLHPDFSPYLLVPHLLGDEGETLSGYVSLVSALALRGLIQQIPGTIHVVTKRQRRRVDTPVGRFEFHRIAPALFGGFDDFGIRIGFPLATAEKAVFDTLLFAVKRGRRFRSLPELRFPRGFRIKEVDGWIARIRDPRARSALTGRWRDLRLRAQVEAEDE
jgi:predicted transcriptional regulator of viral defense system